jgi:hypothetical protein
MPYFMKANPAKPSQALSTYQHGNKRGETEQYLQIKMLEKLIKNEKALIYNSTGWETKVTKCTLSSGVWNIKEVPLATKQPTLKPPTQTQNTYMGG